MTTALRLNFTELLETKSHAATPETLSSMSIYALIVFSPLPKYFEGLKDTHVFVLNYLKPIKQSLIFMPVCVTSC